MRRRLLGSGGGDVLFPECSRTALLSFSSLFFLEQSWWENSPGGTGTGQSCKQTGRVALMSYPRDTGQEESVVGVRKSGVTSLDPVPPAGPRLALGSSPEAPWEARHHSQTPALTTSLGHMTAEPTALGRDPRVRGPRGQPLPQLLGVVDLYVLQPVWPPLP